MMTEERAKKIASNRNGLSERILKGRHYTAEHNWNGKPGWSVASWRNGFPFYIEHD